MDNLNFGAMTAREKLEIVRNAIFAIVVSGQSYSIGGRSLQRANLRELRDMEAALLYEIESGGKPDALIGSAFAALFERR